MFTSRGVGPSGLRAADLDGWLELSAGEGTLAWGGHRRAVVIVRAARGIRGRFRSIVVAGASGGRAHDLVVNVHYTSTTCAVTVRKRSPPPSSNALVDLARRDLPHDDAMRNRREYSGRGRL